MTAVAGAIPPRYRRLVGVCALLLTAWVAIDGHLWSFEYLDQHRFTARALLAGTLKLRSALQLIVNDEQIYNGAAYTNWGYGVALLQLPFHALAAALGLLNGFFPDRAIYFFYAAAAIPIFWAACDRCLSDRAPEMPSLERGCLSWAATWLALMLALFPLTATRFIIYEETIAYFVVLELLTLSAYVFALRAWPYQAVAWMGVASGMALLVRPTGLLYGALWALVVAREGRAKKCLAFLGAMAPFAAFWLWTNRVRTGSYAGLGYENSTPGWAYNLPIERFGSHCSDTPVHAAHAALRLFTGFFFFVTGRASDGWLYDCHFDFEKRAAGWLPFFGPVVLTLVAALIVGVLARRERRPELYAPYVLMTVLFCMFVRRGMGFAWRYTGDFWPAILIGVVQYVCTRGRAPARLSPGLQARLMVGYGAFVFFGLLYPPPVPETVDTSLTGFMEWRFQRSRSPTSRLPSRLLCGERLEAIFQNGLGWTQSCGVDTFTNVALGVPAKPGDRYRLRAKTEGMSLTTRSLRVYVNGAIYAADKTGDCYEADVTIPYARLDAPVVIVTVEWTGAFEAPPGKLLWIELV